MKELRHHMALMYRSSQANEDKTSILMFNNPMPDFSDAEGTEGPKRYWPSWIDQVWTPAHLYKTRILFHQSSTRHRDWTVTM